MLILIKWPLVTYHISYTHLSQVTKGISPLLEVVLWNLGEICSVNWRPTKKMRFWGHFDLKTASEVKSDLRFKAQTTCYHIGLTVLAYFWTFIKKERRKMNLSLLDLTASPQVKSKVQKFHVPLHCRNFSSVSKIRRRIRRSSLTSDL